MLKKVGVAIFVLCVISIFGGSGINGIVGAVIGAVMAVLGFLSEPSSTKTTAQTATSDVVELDDLPDSYVILDTETTGLDPKTCEIIQVAAILYDRGREVKRFQSYVKPQNGIPERITKMTGISDADVANAPSASSVSRKLSDFIGKAAVAGYNVKFDVSFLQSCMGLSFPSGIFDVLKFARKWIDSDSVRNYKLKTLKTYLGIRSASHDAMADVETTQAVLEFCQNKREAYGR